MTSSRGQNTVSSLLDENRAVGAGCLKMARRLRVQYPGAVHHVMNRGDRREAILNTATTRNLLPAVFSVLLVVLPVTEAHCRVVVEVCSDAGAALQAMYRQSLESGAYISLPEDARTPLERNSPSNILAELDGKSFAQALERGLLTAGVTNVTSRYKLMAFWIGDDLTLQPAYKSDAMPKADAGLLCELVGRYAYSRLAGHSQTFALLSLETGQSNHPARPEMEAERLSRINHIPPGWLRKSTNDSSYFVIDGPIAWVYGSPDGIARRDAKEYDPAFKASLDEARAEVMASTGTAGGAQAYYRRVQSLMKRKHGLDWFSPFDLNAGLQIDLAPRPPK